MGTTLTIRKGDITAFGGDAIANAANPPLLGGGGVDGAIHRVAGPQLREYNWQFPEIRPLVRLETGFVRVSPGFDLPARWVLSTVGPFNGEPGTEPYDGVRASEDPEELLTGVYLCYKHLFDTALAMGLRSLALTGISSGVFGVPLEIVKMALTMALTDITEDADFDITLYAFLESEFKLFSDVENETEHEGLPDWSAPPLSTVVSKVTVEV